MNPVTIAALVQVLGPIFIPLIANAVTWLFNKSISLLSKPHQDLISPFLPVVAAGVGTALGAAFGNGPLEGVVGGLAATGLHQMVTQPAKAVKKGTLAAP